MKLEEALWSEASVELFAPIERSGLRESPSAKALSGHLSRIRFLEPERDLKMCLQSLRVQYEEMTSRFTDTKLFDTLPPWNS